LMLAMSGVAKTSDGDRKLSPIKATLSDIADTKFSEIPLPPLKTLPTTSEGTTFTCGNFPAPLLTEAANAEARLSDVLRNPWNNSVTLSDIADTEFSEIARAPVKTLPMTSEGTTFTCANFPAPFLTEAAT